MINLDGKDWLKNMKTFIIPKDKNIVFNADDFGKTKSVSDAIDLCFRRNVIDRATVMVNMPYVAYATNLAERGDYLNKVGLHLNLVEGYPILPQTATSFLCTDGVFNGIVLKSRYHFFLKKNEKRIIHDEVEAQIKKYLSLGYELGHLDSHHHIHTKTALFIPIRKLLLDYGFKSVRLTRNVFDNKISIIRKIYIYIYNKILIGTKLNNKIEYFCPASSLNNRFNTEAITEVMVHPDLFSDRVVDVSGNRNTIMLDQNMVML